MIAALSQLRPELPGGEVLAKICAACAANYATPAPSACAATPIPAKVSISCTISAA